MPSHRLTRACCGGSAICLGLGAADGIAVLTGADIWLTFGFAESLLDQAQDELPLSQLLAGTSSFPLQVRFDPLE